MEQTRTNWGRVRFGGRRINALIFAALVGIPLAIGTALTAWACGTIAHPAIGIPVLAFMAYFPITGSAYVIVVDRNTLKNAAKDPDESVENHWYNLAAQKAFTDVVLVTGLALFVRSIVGFELDMTWTLTGVLLVAAASFGIRYAIIARREA